MKTNPKNKMMKMITNAADLKNTVRELEIMQLEKEELLKQHAHALLEQAKPINILKRAVVYSPVVKGAFTKTGIAGNLLQIGAGFLLNRVFKKRS